jgi:hypothetical protein
MGYTVADGRSDMIVTILGSPKPVPHPHRSEKPDPDSHEVKSRKPFRIILMRIRITDPSRQKMIHKKIYTFYVVKWQNVLCSGGSFL